MISVRISFINLLWLQLIFSVDYGKCNVDTEKPSIRSLKAITDKQSLGVSWLVNHSGSVGEVYEIQIGRTEKRTIVYNKNVTVSSGDPREYTWTWISDLPLDCVDHSVRIRNLYNQSVSSPWSNWTTNYGFKANDKTKIFPSEQVLREGSNPKFCCVPPVGVNITGMTFRGVPYPLESIGDGVKAITIKNLAIPKESYKFLTIQCNDTTGKPCYTSNHVSFPPQKPLNLSCTTSNMTNITCTWDVARKRDQYDRNLQTHTLHIENSGQAPINCMQSACTFPAVPQLQEYNISLVVKDKLGEEAVSYSFNILDRVFPIVELDRVSPGVTDATLSWIVQGNLSQMNPLCQVSTVPDSTRKLNCNEMNGFCEVRLEHLLPNTDYSTRVCCSVNGKLWGEWTQPISFTTDPLVTLDLWRRLQLRPNNRLVTLLWNPVNFSYIFFNSAQLTGWYNIQIPFGFREIMSQLTITFSTINNQFYSQHIVGTATTVNIQNYKVQWSQDGKIQTVDSGQSQAEISIGPERCDFTVQAVLHTGSSIAANITLPPMDHTEKLPVPKRLNTTTAGGFNLTWDELSTVTCSYTVEWCSLGNAVPCTLQWVMVPKGNNTLFLPAGNFKAGHRYTFNIYGCTENGHKLLEIQTGYSKELKSTQAPRLVAPVQSTPSSVTLEWRYDENDPAQPAFIIGYLVTVQGVGSDMKREVLVADPLKKSVTIEGLQHNQEYSCSVSDLTKEGPGPAVSVIVRTRINYSAYLAKILTPILLVLGCTVLLWPQRKMLKKIFTYPSGMNIKIPTFDSVLNETDQRLHSQKVEECISCVIEIVNTEPLLTETTPLTEPEPANILCSPGPDTSPASMTPSCEPIQADYCPQSATLHWDRPTLHGITSITNKSYLYSVVGDYSEPQEVTSSEIKSSVDPSDCLQESCAVIYGYVSNDTV